MGVFSDTCPWPWSHPFKRSMHAFLLPHTPWWAAWKYVKGIPWWLPADQLLERLKAPGPAANSAVDAA